ncbi:hypothetical protein [Luteimonas terrae]|uniref:Lipoprotein n=1 Tax=Luteimonas terrae TaxID=1530191 RepID=A0ABU1XSU5_9GAMM|nr:hypothetical protein [Luteimonas terrae]MDR7191800.1 hypothetical protein [Luteimonas terrae]
MRLTLLVAVVLAPLASLVTAADTSAGAHAKAGAWVGRDASALLMELRVDGGRIQIDEDDATLETRYTWRTVTPAWTERIHVSGGELIGVTVRNNVHMPHYTPIIYDEVDHPEKHRCDITYVADREGVVRRFELKGPDCDEDVVGPKGS